MWSLDTHTYEMCLVARPPEVLGQQGVAGVQAIGVITANTRPLQTQPVGVVTRQKSCSENIYSQQQFHIIGSDRSSRCQSVQVSSTNSSSGAKNLCKRANQKPFQDQEYFIWSKTANFVLLFQHSPRGRTLGMEVWAVEDSARVRHPLEAGGDHVRVVPRDVIPAQVIRQHHN